MGYLAKPLSTLFLEIVLFTERGLKLAVFLFGWLVSKLLESSCPYLHPKSMLGLRACKAIHGFFMGVRDSDSGLCSWTASVLTHSVITSACFQYLV